MFPEWHHAVPESAYFKVPETLKTFPMYPISRFVYVLHWLATRLNITVANVMCVKDLVDNEVHPKMIVLSSVIQRTSMGTPVGCRFRHLII